MDLMQLKTVQWLSILGAFAGILGLFALWESPWRPWCMAAILALSVLFYVLELKKDRLTVLVSGAHRYIRSFSVDDNSVVFDSIQKEYCYFGISFDSVKTAFLSWYVDRRRGDCKIRLLLMNPDADELLHFQARYEKKFFGKDLTSAEQEIIDNIVERTKLAIRSTLQSLATLPTAPANIEIKFHQNCAREWTHEVDNQILYLGMLRSGSRGLDAPVLLLKRRKYWSMFDHYHDGWESLWERSGNLIEFMSYKTGNNPKG